MTVVDVYGFGWRTASISDSIAVTLLNEIRVHSIDSLLDQCFQVIFILDLYSSGDKFSFSYFAGWSSALLII